MMDTDKVRQELAKLKSLIDLYNLDYDSVKGSGTQDKKLKLVITKEEMLKSTQRLSRLLTGIEEKV